MCHTFKHLIHKQYFLLLTNFVIVFVHWVSTGVLYEPRKCSLFWDYIPESKLCFCVNLCFPSGPYSIRPIHTLLNCQTTTRLINQKQKTALWLWSLEMTWYLYPRGVRGRMKAKQRCFKVTRELCPQSFDVHTVSQSRSVVTSVDNPAPGNSPESIGELRNGHMANL